MGRRREVNEAVQWFRPTSGRLLGPLALAACFGLVVLAFSERDQDYALRLGFGAIFVGVLAWSSMVRPGLGIVGSTLVLRNMLETVHVPLAAIEELAIRQVLVLRAGDRRYVSPAIGKTWRHLLKSPRAAGASAVEHAMAGSYPDFVETCIRQLSQDARDEAGIKRGSAEHVALGAGVRRVPARIEIGLLLVTGLGLIFTLMW
jgi:hypothetical protein